MDVVESRGANYDEVSDEGEESIEEAKPQGEIDLVRLFKSALETSSRPRIEVPTYEGSLNVEELIDQINYIDKYFHYQKVDEEKRVKFVMTKLRGHAYIWWNGMQVEKVENAKKR